MNLPKPGSHIHLIGICGTAMGSLAGILQSMGYKVTGSDKNVYPPMSTQLQDLGIQIIEGYEASNLDINPDFVVVGNVISKHFPEADRLIHSEIPYTSQPKAMGEFVIEDRESLVVAGTHGKTTTTSMLTWVAEVAGLKPGYLIGGIPLNFEKSFRAPQANTFVIEGDEYDTAFFDKVPKFIHYKPKHVIFTSCEFDHADIYADMEEIRKSFRMLMELIPEDGTLVFNHDDPEVVELAKLAKCKTKFSYGIEGGDFQSVERQTVVGRNQFSVKTSQGKEADIAIKLFGKHNTLNALGAYALGRALGWRKRDILQGLATFLGVKRRQEILGTPGGVEVIEDFAHHPTAVQLTIESIQERKPGAKVIAIFEPRSATARLKVFQDDFMKALSGADGVALPTPYDQSKIPEDQRFSSQEVIHDLSTKGVNSFLGKDVDDIVSWVGSQAKPGDTVLVMSNGGFDGIYDKLLKQLETGPPQC